MKFQATRTLISLFIICLVGCEDKDKTGSGVNTGSGRMVFVPPTGLLFWLTIISFAIAVFCALNMVIADDTPGKRGAVGGVGLIFLIVSMLLLFSQSG